jgi:hypothetical protein
VVRQAVALDIGFGKYDLHLIRTGKVFNSISFPARPRPMQERPLRAFMRSLS